jgi:predicted O-methyltransferase YrrM
MDSYTESIIQRAKILRPLTEINEREELINLAKEVPPHGLIVEVGTMYGGGTAILAYANPYARIISIDNFSWFPPDGSPSSKQDVEENLELLDIHNVEIMEGDSITIGKEWNTPIDFIFIDGGHEYETAYADLVMLGSHAKVIAIHDFNNPWLHGVNKAVEDFMAIEPDKWKIEKVVHWVAVLRRVE